MIRPGSFFQEFLKLEEKIFNFLSSVFRVTEVAGDFDFLTFFVVETIKTHQVDEKSDSLFYLFVLSKRMKITVKGYIL
jgi:hypothetical protein